MEEKILNIFKKEPDTFLSGEDISAALNISRSAFWKHIEKLRASGYEFEAVPNLGYRLVKTPDRLYPQEITFNLKTQLFGKAIFHYDITSSTNTVAHDLAKQGAKEGTLVVAEKQTHGRGRLMRDWVSPMHKGIYMSIILRPNIPPYQAPKITLTAAVATALAIREFAGLEARLKWPNDILVNNKKVGGMLTEIEAETDSINFLILGIGINVNTKLSELPKGATSLFEEASEKVSRVELIKVLLEKLEQHYMLFKKEGFAPVTREWRNLSATLGKRVRVSCQNRKIEGEAVGLDADGALLIRLDNGFQEKILSGDLGMLR